MSKEVATRSANAVSSELASAADEVFADMHIDQSDLVIPKVLLMQPTSAFVADGKAGIGDFRHSLSGEKLGTIVDPLEIVPFHFTKCIDVVDAREGAGNKLLRKDEFTAANAKLPREDVETINGQQVKVRRYTRLDFFCMVPALVKAGSSLPVVVSFKSTGYRAGGIILTEWQDIQASNIKAKQEGRMGDLRLPFAKTFKLAGTKTTNEKKQTFCVPSIQVSGVTDVEMQKLCLQWLKTVKNSASVRVDDRDEREEEHVVVADGTGAF